MIQNNPLGDEHGSAECLHRGRFCRLGTSAHVLDIRKVREEVANCVSWALSEICPGYGRGRINALMYISTITQLSSNHYIARSHGPSHGNLSNDCFSTYNAYHPSIKFIMGMHARGVHPQRNPLS